MRPLGWRAWASSRSLCGVAIRLEVSSQTTLLHAPCGRPGGACQLGNAAIEGNPTPPKLDMLDCL